MTRTTIAAAVSAFASLFATLPAMAADEPAEIFSRNVRYHTTYVVNPDGSGTTTVDQAVKIVHEKVLERMKRAGVSYSTSVERAEILEAYTLKADGRRIDAPKSNYQLDINKGSESGAPAFSDRTQQTVILPDVAVGDTVVFVYRTTQTEPLFPGHFSVTEQFSRSYPYDDVKVRIDAPAGLWTQHAVTEMTETLNETRDGRKVVEWTWKNPQPMKDKRRNYTAYDPDKQPGFSYSTFRTYGEISAAYGERARPKAVVSDRVKVLADEVTKGKTGAREQARALYEWVATNIHFAGNCVGVGAVVPRDQAFVIDNKMGDCKDHATLLQAMLAAKGIVSTQALVNAGSVYRLPKVPVLSRVNHVIVYVPSLDLYLDSTSSSTPFGMLPSPDVDKPVLLVDGYKDGMRTPPARSDRSKTHMKTDVTIKPDGSVTGTVQVNSTGDFAATARSAYRDLSEQQIEEVMKRMYKRNNKTGFGKMVSDDPKPLLDTFEYKVQFEFEDYTRMPGPGAFSIGQFYYGEGSISMFAGAVDEDDGVGVEETACSGGTVIEEYTYHFPKGMKVLATPKNATATNKWATFRSTYQLKGNVLHVKREVVDKTDRNVCPGTIVADFAALHRVVAQDLKAQVVYQ
ncbi:hypothetical protein BWI17_07070 [Betaproteobacteria bacterium GR16-43]|nr:hypothetical protein BWI17_07070 [Betaproteobacteria bacterium GR16-43]